MNYEQALEYIHETQKFGCRPGLESIGSLLEYLGNPQKKLKYVHVAGTNGKGSTVAFISQILMEAGYSVGTYTSPYLQRFTERVKVNGREVPQEDIARLTDIVSVAVNLMRKNGEENPTEFDLVTAMAFLYFAQRKCDIVVLEVGLGGRLDSTNIIDFPEVAVITTISYDHMEILGDTLPKIAFEKAGIIKNGCEVVLYPQNPEAELVFKQVCKDRGADLHQVDFSHLTLLNFSPSGQKFDFENYTELEISLIGDHQLGNAAMAVRAAEVLNSRGYSISEENIRRGLAETAWPGRLEIIRNHPLMLIDGAHNVQGVFSLKECLLKYFPGRKFTFIVGVLADKEYRAMMDIIAPLAERFIAVTPYSPRALASKDLAAVLGKYGKNVSSYDKVEDALTACNYLCRQDELICVFGSLYFIGKVRDFYNLR